MYAFDSIVLMIFISLLTIIISLNIISVFQKSTNNMIKQENFTVLPNDKSPMSIIMMNNENKKELDKEKESVAKLSNPDEANIVHYENYICYKKNNNNQVVNNNNNNNNKTCKNESLNNKYSYGVQALDPFPVGYQKSWYDIDPSNYYKKYRPIMIPMEDKLLKGYNVERYNTASGIYDIGRINLNNNTNKYAQPNNYILMNQ